MKKVQVVIRGKGSNVVIDLVNKKAKKTLATNFKSSAEAREYGDKKGWIVAPLEIREASASCERRIAKRVAKQIMAADDEYELAEVPPEYIPYFFGGLKPDTAYVLERQGANSGGDYYVLVSSSSFPDGEVPEEEVLGEYIPSQADLWAVGSDMGISDILYRGARPASGTEAKIIVEKSDNQALLLTPSEEEFGNWSAVETRIATKITNEILGYGRRSPGGRRKQWMAKMDGLVKKEVPDIAMKRKQDYWDTATFLFNSGDSPEEAAKKMLKQYK